MALDDCALAPKLDPVRERFVQEYHATWQCLGNLLASHSEGSVNLLLHFCCQAIKPILIDTGNCVDRLRIITLRIELTRPADY